MPTLACSICKVQATAGEFRPPMSHCDASCDATLMQHQMKALPHPPSFSWPWFAACPQASRAAWSVPLATSRPYQGATGPVHGRPWSRHTISDGACPLSKAFQSLAEQEMTSLLPAHQRLITLPCCYSFSVFCRLKFKNPRRSGVLSN